MAKLQKPVFPSGSTVVAEGISVECSKKQVVYFSGLLPMFQHAEDDLQSFRMFTSQLIDMGVARQVDIVKIFGVPLPTVKRYLKLFRSHGAKAFFAEPKRRSALVLTAETLSQVEEMLIEGSSVPEAAKSAGIKANTLHKAIRAGRLRGVKKKYPLPSLPLSPLKASAAIPTAKP